MKKTLALILALIMLFSAFGSVMSEEGESAAPAGEIAEVEELTASGSGTDDTDPETVESTEPETVEGTEPETVEGTEPETVEGTEPETVEGTEPETVEGTDPETVEGTELETVEGTETETAEDTEPETVEGTEPETVEGTEPETAEDETPAAFSEGYIVLASGTEIYKTKDKSDKLATVSAKSTVYAVYSSDDESAKWYKISFDTEEAAAEEKSAYQAYVLLADVNALSEDETALLTQELTEAGSRALDGKYLPFAYVTFEETKDEPKGPSRAPAAATLTITQQPQDISANLGDMITISIAATGTGTLAYQWYVKNAGSDTWAASKYRVASYEVEFKSAMINRQYRCVVTDANGSVTSEAMTVTKYVAPQPLTITQQPQDVSANLGDMITISIEATGSGTLTYQWYVKNAGSDTWAASKYKVASYQVQFLPAMVGRQYRCIVTDETGESVTSEAMTVSKYAEPEPLTITQQPQDVSANLGDMITISIEATGTGTLTYQWYVKNAGSDTWAASKYKVASYQVQFLPAMVGRQYRCVVTDETGSVTSEAMTVSKYAEPEPLTITQQPQDVSANLNDMITISIEATGTGELSYQWYVKNAGSDTWAASKYKVASYQVKFLPAMVGRQYRCVVTDETGESVTSDPMTVSLRGVDTPTGLSVSEIHGLFTLTWDEVAAADSYEVYISDAEDGEYTLVSTWSTASGEVEDPDTADTYFFKVSATGTVGGQTMTSELSSAVSIVASGIRVTDDGVFVYKKNADKTGIVIVSYEGVEATVTVPATLSGLPIVVIGEAAFKGNTILQEIDLPDTVEIIDAEAFMNCTSLRSMY